jgi:anti-sigma B factor antagonist
MSSTLMFLQAQVFSQLYISKLTYQVKKLDKQRFIGYYPAEILLSFFWEITMADIKPRISVEYVPKAVIVSFTDEKILEEKDINALQESIMSVIEQSEKINLILDFRNVRFLSSAVLGLLIRISKRIYEAEGKLRLCNINPKIYEIFKITRLTKTFDIYKNVESATEDLS